MGKPAGNGLIELVDEKSHDRGFFCMKLTGYIMQEHREMPDSDMQDLWEKRFTEAKAGNCAYHDICPIYARTMTRRLKQGLQLSFEFL